MMFTLQSQTLSQLSLSEELTQSLAIVQAGPGQWLSILDFVTIGLLLLVPVWLIYLIYFNGMYLITFRKALFMTCFMVMVLAVTGQAINFPVQMDRTESIAFQQLSVCTHPDGVSATEAALGTTPQSVTLREIKSRVDVTKDCLELFETVTNTLTSLNISVDDEDVVQHVAKQLPNR